MLDTAEIDDIMYRLYGIDKIRKGREAVLRGEVVSIEDLKKKLNHDNLFYSRGKR